MITEMVIFRFCSLIVSIIVGYYLLRLVHRQKMSGLEFVIWFALITVIVVLSLFPTILIHIFNYINLSINSRYDRLIGLSYIFIALSFGVIFYYRNTMHDFREQFLTFVQMTSVLQFTDRYKKDKGKYDLLIIIPALNEEKNLPLVLQQVPKTICGLVPRAVVVSDGSTDGTTKVAEKEGAWTAEYPINFGQGMALETGYRCAMAMDTKYLVTLDADGQYQAKDIEKLLQPLVDGRADIVSGSRILGSYEQENVKDRLIRSIGIWFFSIMVTILTGTKITDASSGFRAVKVQHLRGIKFSQEQFHHSELLIECLKKGLRFEEVPVSCLRRTSGESRKPRPFQYGFGFFRTVLNTWIRR